MAKVNCWEFNKCGRQPGGHKVREKGICAAAMASRLNNIHGGKNGGRACWAVAGTLCGGARQGTFASKITSCLICEFYRQVTAEEGIEFIPAKELATIAR